jgi:hypothetical protein
VGRIILRSGGLVNSDLVANRKAGAPLLALLQGAGAGSTQIPNLIAKLHSTIPISELRPNFSHYFLDFTLRYI